MLRFRTSLFQHSANAIPVREIELMTSRKKLLGTIQELQKIKVENLSVEQRHKIVASIDRSYDELKDTADELLDSSIGQLERPIDRLRTIPLKQYIYAASIFSDEKSIIRKWGAKLY